MANLLFIISIIFTVICVLGWIIVTSEISSYEAEGIQTFSTRYHAVMEANSRFHFTVIPPVSYTVNCESKRAYDQFEPDFYLINEVAKNIPVFEKKIADSLANYNIYCDYKRAVDNARTYPRSKADQFIEDSSRRIALESALINSVVQDPYRLFFVEVRYRYISPQGRSSYYMNKQFSMDDMRQIIKRAEIYNYQRQNRAANPSEERAKMTPTLRRAVLRRDNYTCVLCGASRETGARLEVDHIRPISKGGKTEMSNLRTLCFECNRGKGAKYDYFGPN